MPERLVHPEALDLGHLALFVGYAVNDAVSAALAARSYGDLRPSHDFVFQHLVDVDRTIGELAERMQVTQQAASKVVVELEGLGYLVRVTDPEDARVRRVGLTERGRAAITAGRRARAALARRLAARIGGDQVTRARATLAEVLEALGGTAAVRRRRVIAPR